MDVVIVSPFNPTNDPKARQRGGLTRAVEEMKFRQEEKRQKDLAAARPSLRSGASGTYRFVPLAFDINGRPGLQALAVLSELASKDKLWREGHRTFLHPRARWLQGISAAIHSTTASYLLQASKLGSTPLDTTSGIKRKGTSRAFADFMKIQRTRHSY